MKTKLNTIENDLKITVNKLDDNNERRIRLVFQSDIINILRIPIIIKNSYSNCKLAIIDHIGEIYNHNLTDEENKKIILFILDYIFTHYCTLTYFVHIINKNVANIIKENIPHYYFNEVPIGYYKGYQYHILLKNNKDYRATNNE